MKKITKAQARKRLEEARQKLFLVYGFSSDVSDSDAKKLMDIRSKINQIARKLK